MKYVQSFEEFEIWKTGREIVRQIYRLTRQKPFSSDFQLTNQIRRAAVSIISNIAEGYESQTRKIFVRHLAISKGSSGEVRSQLYVALDQGYITDSEFQAVADLCRRESRQLSSFIKYLQNHEP